MNPIRVFLVVFMSGILTSETTACDENSRSRPVITRKHRRLKGFTFNTFRSVSLVSCGLQCQRNTRCVSTNFLKVSSFDETEGICELNDRGVLLPVEGEELGYHEEAVYTQFYDVKVREIFFCSCEKIFKKCFNYPHSLKIKDRFIHFPCKH